MYVAILILLLLGLSLGNQRTRCGIVTGVYKTWQRL